MDYNKWYKILRIVVLIIFIISFFSKVFASFTIVDHLNNGYILPDLPSYPNNQSYNYVILKNTSSGSISCYMYHNFQLYYDTTTNTFKWFKRDPLSTGHSIYFTRLTDNAWSSLTLMENSSNSNVSWYNVSWKVNEDNNATTTNPVYMLFCSETIYLSNGVNATENVWSYGSPIIYNDTTEIEDWDFDDLIIQMNNVEYNLLYDTLKITYNGFEKDLFIYTALDKNNQPSDDTSKLYILRDNINKLFSFVDDSSINFKYIHYVMDGTTISNTVTYDLGTFNILLTSETAEDINNNTQLDLLNSNNQTLNNIENSINNLQTIFTNGQQQQQQAQAQTNQKLDNINNSINDPSIDTESLDLPSMNFNDPTALGIDTIFQGIYTVFTFEGEPSDIVFPIPYTNQNITIDPDYIHDLLENNNGSILLGLANAFWFYVICRFVVKDMARRVEKFEFGDVEHIVEHNIKADMM